MKIRHSDLIGTFEQKQAIVEQFNLMDDDFFAVVMTDKKACEYVLSIILECPVTVISCKTQYAIRNLPSHSVVLDALIEDEANGLYNVEIQVSDKGDHPRRLRYYQSSIDWTMLEKGKGYDELPELYLVFISQFDVFGLNKNKYEIKRIIDGTEINVDNGVHEFYLNTKVTDGTQLSDLLQYFRNSNADDDRFGALSQAVRYHKRTEKGVDSMCQAVEEYGRDQRSEGRAEGQAEGRISEKLDIIHTMLESGVSLEQALIFTKLDKETYEKLSALN